MGLLEDETNTWFKVNVKVNGTDPNSGKNKITKFNYLVNAVDVAEAGGKVLDFLQGKELLAEVSSVAETNFVHVIN